MGVRLSAPDGSREIRRVALDWLQTGTAYTVDLEVVADAAGAAECKVGCSEAGWLEVTDDGGGNWYAVPEDTTTGHDLGPLSANQRKDITLRLTVPAGLPVRHQIVDLYLGLGT